MNWNNFLLSSGISRYSVSKNVFLSLPLKHLHPSLTSFLQQYHHSWISLSIAGVRHYSTSYIQKTAPTYTGQVFCFHPTHFHVLILVSLLYVGHLLPSPQDTFYSLLEYWTQFSRMSWVSHRRLKGGWGQDPAALCWAPSSPKPAACQVISFQGFAMACNAARVERQENQNFKDVLGC